MNLRSINFDIFICFKTKVFMYMFGYYNIKQITNHTISLNENSKINILDMIKCTFLLNNNFKFVGIINL